LDTVIRFSLEHQVKEIKIPYHFTLVLIHRASTVIWSSSKQYGAIIPKHPNVTHIMTLRTDLGITSDDALPGFSVLP